jgi:negative regulator of sigma E activity
MKNTLRTTMTILLTLALLPWAVAAQESAESIMQKVMDSQAADTSAMDIKLTLIDAKGEERERRIQTLTMTEGGLTNTITVFISPASVRNTRFLTREQTINGRAAYKLRSIPNIPGTYVQTLIWVDKEYYLPLRVEFYEREGATISKVLTTDGITQIEGRWITQVVTMATLASGHKTRVEILQARYGIPMHSGYFTTTFLETGRLP